MANKNDVAVQNATPNNLSVGVDRMEHISEWVRLYFETEVTTSERSQKEQRRDLQLVSRPRGRRSAAKRPRSRSGCA